MLKKISRKKETAIRGGEDKNKVALLFLGERLVVCDDNFEKREEEANKANTTTVLLLYFMITGGGGGLACTKIFFLYLQNKQCNRM